MSSFTFADRLARVHRFTWNPDGTPNFGKPLPMDAEIKEPQAGQRLEIGTNDP